MSETKNELERVCQDITDLEKKTIAVSIIGGIGAQITYIVLYALAISNKEDNWGSLINLIIQLLSLVSYLLLKHKFEWFLRCNVCGVQFEKTDSHVVQAIRSCIAAILGCLITYLVQFSSIEKLEPLGSILDAGIFVTCGLVLILTFRDVKEIFDKLKQLKENKQRLQAEFMQQQANVRCLRHNEVVGISAISEEKEIKRLKDTSPNTSESGSDAEVIFRSDSSIFGSIDTTALAVMKVKWSKKVAIVHRENRNNGRKLQEENTRK